MKIEVQYQSPVIRYDSLAQTEIFERRNAETGAISYQDPSADEVRKLERAARGGAAPGADLAPKPTTPVQAADDPGPPQGGVSLIV